MTNSNCQIKASATCCTSRRPPSPDGEAPRPVELSPSSPRPKPKKLLSKDHIPSWVTIGPKELRDIVEEEVPNGADQIQYIQHKDPDVFRQMAEVATNTELVEQLVHIKTKKSTTTLKTVTRKLKQHLSGESTVSNSKRHSRSSIGTSEEEVERRAELKRIRQKRIEEELSLDDLCDDDAKSFSFVHLSPTPPTSKKTTLPRWKPGDFVPLPHLTPPALVLPRLALPHLSPIEKRNAEAYFTGSATTMLNSRRWSGPEMNTAIISSDTGLSRSFSSPYFAGWEVMQTDPLLYVPSRKESSIPSIPPQPILQATKLPSISLPRRSSWRLSFAAEDRGCNLRRLGLGTAVPMTLDLDQLRSKPPPPKRGIYVAGLNISPQAVLTPSVSSTPMAIDLMSMDYLSDHDLGGVDGEGSPPATVHLHEIDISRRLASRGLQTSSSSLQLSRSNSVNQTVSFTSEAMKPSNEKSRALRRTNDSALSGHIPSSWGQVAERNTSSVYPSVSSSVQPSRESSRFNLFSLLPGNRNKIEAADYQDLVTAQRTLKLPDTSTANTSSISLTIAQVRHPHRSTVDDSSLLASETSSFREREAELNAVQTRFAEARRSPSTPVSSKFREEFRTEAEEHPVTQAPRASTFSKLTKFAIKSYDGAKVEELLDIPVPKFDPHELRTPLPPGARFNALDDDAGKLWGAVLKKKGDEREQSISDKLHVPPPRRRNSPTARKKSAVEDEMPKSVFGNIAHLGKGKKKNAAANKSRTAAEEYNERFQERLAVKELVMDSWEEEMAASAERAKARSKNIVKKVKPSGSDRRYPATWSRFPSHDREERTSAGPAHKVEVKDFAVLGHKDGEIIWCLEHDEEGHHSVIDDDVAHGLRSKLKERLRHKAYKFDTSDRQTYQTSGRRGSLTVGKEPEYPELEILPVTLMTGDEIAMHIEREKQIERRSSRIDRREIGSAFGPSLRALGVDGGSETHQPSPVLSPRSKVSVVSITNPKFVDDCMTHFEAAYEMQKGNEDVNFVRSATSERVRTWAGRDFDAFKLDRAQEKRASLGSVVLK